MVGVHKYKYLRELPQDQFDALYHFLSCDMGHKTTANELCHALNLISTEKKVEERKKRGVLITTSCGEEHHFDPAQNVETIMLNDEQVYPPPDWIDNVKVGDMVRAIKVNTKGATHGFVLGDLYKVTGIKTQSYHKDSCLVVKAPDGLHIVVFNYSVAPA